MNTDVFLNEAREVIIPLEPSATESSHNRYKSWISLWFSGIM